MEVYKVKKLFVVLLFALSFGLSGMGLPLPEDPAFQDLDSNPFWEGGFPALPATDPEDFSWLQQPDLEISKNKDSDSLGVGYSGLEDFQPVEESAEYSQLSGSKRSVEENIVGFGSVNSKRPKKHICNWEGCSKAFSKISNLNDHERIHTGEKPFACDWMGCGKSFTQKSKLKDHKRIHKGEKPYVCDWMGCGFASSDSSSLKSHELIHKGEKPYVCKDCGKAFAKKSNLKDHKRIHKGEKPFKCDSPDCNFASAQKSNLKVHIRRKHPELAH